MIQKPKPKQTSKKPKNKIKNIPVACEYHFNLKQKSEAPKSSGVKIKLVLVRIIRSDSVAWTKVILIN